MWSFVLYDVIFVITIKSFISGAAVTWSRTAWVRTVRPGAADRHGAATAGGGETSAVYTNGAGTNT